jgi:hypothetical protein
MFLVAFDSKRLISVSLHVGEALSEVEFQMVLDTIDKSAAALDAAGKDAFFTTLILVDTDKAPNAAQRKRIGEATKRLTRGYQVLVTRSAVVRAFQTAIRWFSPANDQLQHQTFATYEEARSWLVPRTGHTASVFDEMRADLLAQARARQGQRSSA